MTLPTYIVNLEELLPFITPKQNESEVQDFKKTGVQKVKGFRLVTTEGKSSVSEFWFPPSDILITGVKIGVSSRNNWKKDSLDLIIKDEIIFDNLYMKDIVQYKNFRVFKLVKENEKIEIVYKGSKKEAEVWIDIDYIIVANKIVHIYPNPTSEID